MTAWRFALAGALGLLGAAAAAQAADDAKISAQQIGAGLPRDAELGNPAYFIDRAYKSLMR